MELKKKDTNELIYKREIDPDRKSLMVTKGESGGGGINWEFEFNIYTLLYIKYITRTYCIAQGTILNIL